ncbi:MAG TPA: D-amino-acid transaminase [Bacillus sp. (in: firmicutes)]|uniref:D-amino-acid transaminase n=1 Tax=Bacillus litorisediminis TaxID=2922713 RepID=UPI001FAF552C|nr:D-amino-acid transaminase [Bacillus litorisediminis]HWO75736.1 D-amino-acid transaminase [Bacillus sp. (in: firmicutes)]
MEKVLWNGKIVNKEDVRISIDDRAFHFGDGVYEVVRVYDGELYLADGHMKRLYDSARKIGIQLDITPDDFLASLVELREATGLIDGTIYVQVSRGEWPRNHAFPDQSVAPQIVGFTKQAKRPLEQMKSGVKATIIEDTRWLHCDIKSISLLGNVLAKQKAVEAGCFESIQHRDGVVTEGSSTNVFIVKDATVYTHPANHLILNGITRQRIIELGRKEGINIREEAFTADQLLQADEVFVAGTTVEIMPVIQVDDKKYSDQPGPVTLKLQSLLNEDISQLASVKH